MLSRPQSDTRRGTTLIRRYQSQWVLIVAIAWTVIDLIYWIRYMQLGVNRSDDPIYSIFNLHSIVLRGIIVCIMSTFMGYLLIFRMREVFRELPLIVNLLLKTVILMMASFIMNFLLHFTYSLFILRDSIFESFYHFYRDCLSTLWLLQHSIGWILLFVITQLIIEINEKYSPGVFIDILIGKYIHPQNEKRIVIFLDLKDSTTIAEQLGNKTYFRFIRDFIYHASLSLLEYDGRIYQYVGDEIVASWMCNRKNAKKCIRALSEAVRRFRHRTRDFERKYGVFPEFRVGIHAGEVTVGEIGVIKKDLAMSGDTMNTAARIRSACATLEHSYICSRDFLDQTNLEPSAVPLGTIDLKGKSAGVELFGLKL